MILSNNQLEYFNPVKAIKWILTSNDYENDNDIKRINKLIDLIYKESSQNSIEIIKKYINDLNDLIKLTSNKRILTPLFTVRNCLIKQACNLALNNIKTLEDLDIEYAFF